ncbi:autotransporter outer membrane beta-barrel domain-containing protein [Candidatus Tisiphia endosymbiont of Parasteatoda lunata]|uniref:autotransporter outer membrane beta-barrel domain-containing protein n=1 Tax=Candidatus Tisiphia endosymbiont of Parasteatoda lunata TaxID=3066275 RepID=UPI00313D0C9F
MAKKQKSFKYLLASSAIASVVAGLGSSGVAFGGAVPDAVLMIGNAELSDTPVGGQNHWNAIDQHGVVVNPADFIYAPQDNEAFTYGDDFTLNANRLDAIITAINLANHNPGILRVSQNLSIGSIVPDAHGAGAGAGRLPIKIEAGHTLTLTGTPAAVADHGFDAGLNTYTGLGNVELGGAGSTLVVHSGGGDIAVGSVSAGVHQQGVLTFTTGGTVGQIGANGASLAAVNIGAEAVTLGGNVWATNTNLADIASVLNLAAGTTINGAVDNTGGAAAAGAAAGILNFAGAGNVTGAIGATKALAAVNFEGAGDVHLRQAAKAQTFTFNEVATLHAHEGITGNVHFNHNDGTIKLTDGKTIDGNITTQGSGEGILTFDGDGEVTGGIGATKALAAVNFEGAGDVHLRQAAKAQTFTFNEVATLHAHEGITGNVHFNHNDGTIKLTDGKTIDGNITTQGSGEGILTFDGDGEVTGGIGATKALAAVNFEGAGDVHLRQAAKAQTFTFNEVATLHAHEGITGNVHFNHNDGTIKLTDGKTIDGNITTQGSGEGILTFDGDGEVTGGIGAINANPALNRLISRININAAGKNVILKQNVYTNKLNFAAASTVKIGGDFVGGVNFNAGGTLEFNGADGPGGRITLRFFKSTIQGGANGTLNVNTSLLVATNAQIGKIKTINIGAAGVGNNKALAIDASAADVTLLGRVNPGIGVAVNQNINFMHADSMLGLFTSGHNSTIIFHANLSGGVPDGHGGFAGDGGIVWLDGDDTRTLTVQSVTGGETLGIVGNKLGELRISRRVTIAGDNTPAVHNKLNVQHANKLSIINGATFTDKSTTSAQIEEIHIGAASADVPTPAGPANYILDAEHINFNLNAHADNQITFDHADAQLTLRNSAAGNKTITLLNNLNPGAPNKGVVEFDSVNDGAELKIDGAGLSLGTAVNKLKKVIFSGRGKFDTRAIIIHSKNIELNVNELTLGDVNSNILFVNNTVLTVGNITGNVDFQNHDGTVKLEAGKRINGSVTSTGDAKGTLEFLGIGEVTSLITNLKMLRAGAGNVRLVGGNYTITEIQGKGVGDLTFANNFNLTGSINSTGGNAVGLIFEGNNRVTGVVGTATSPVGTIQVQGTTVFGDKVQTANDQDIIISAGATAEFANSVTTRNIKGHAAGQGTVQFSNAETIIVNSAIGATNAVDTLDIAGADVKLTQAVSANYINFSNASKEVTLTLERTSTVGGIRTNGNNVHTLALAADFTTGIQDIGLEKNRLKSIKLLGDHKITINSGVYSDISTQTNNTGKVIFNLNRSFAYNLGTNKLRLSDVTFAKNATVRGDVYSKQITIASDKTATFAGTINRTISVPNSTVDGASISRSLKSFAYSTQIGSDEIKNEGIAKFDKAVLVDAKITGGKVTFTDNVWFKQTANGKEVNFAADKFVILEQNISFANIKADKAKIIILPKTASITGNLAAKGLTVDLAANQLKYTGQAQLTGDVELVTAYDPSSAAGGNIEVQKGSKLDLSKADQLTIKVNARTDINKIPEGGAKYVVISSVDGQGLVAIDHSKIKLDPTGEQNRFVQWSMDSSDLKLYITDISKEVIDKDIAGKSLSQEERKFYTLLNNVTDRNSSAGKFRNNIGLMDREHALQAMDRILPGNENPIGESLARNPTSEIIRGLMAQADTQITATRMGNSVPMKNAASAVGSSDDDTLRYGVWGSPFYGTACQETYKGVSGYKAKSAGGIVGFDGLVNDNLLLGAAYSRINTQMSHQDKKFGDKTNGKTNIFSLYSLYNLTNNWFTEAIASYGITRVRNSEGRLIATNVKRNVTALETAAAKYKSISYSGQLLTGYNYIASEKLMITPTIGFRYSQFKDAGYTETGTKFQNLVVKKRSYNKFEGILGLRTAATLKANKVLLIPELHGYVNHDFKGKAPIIDARLDGINEPLPTKSVKPVKTFFTVGTGFTAKYNMMECGIIYNVNIASKYIGHQGSLKVKVNF